MNTVHVLLTVFTVRSQGLEALLVRHPGTAWALPGGPLGAGEALEASALRLLADQTGVRGLDLEQLYTFDGPGDAAVSVAHLALIAAPRHPLSAGPHEVEVRWFPHDDLPALPALHADAVAYGRARLRAKSAYAPVAVQLLPETFTLSELQAVYEAVLSARLDPRNFRRDVLAAGIVRATGRTRTEGPGRPARLYRYTGGDFAVVAQERRAARALSGPD
jgi:8-oxo-dGTP diphosphatase